jgi:hypothetical protein
VTDKGDLDQGGYEEEDTGRGVSILQRRT